MSSWLSDLEKRKRDAETRKRGEEEAENLRRDREKARELRLKEQYEAHHKEQVDSIGECVNQLVSRAKAAGVLDLHGWGGVFVTKDAFGVVSLRIATIETSHWSSRVEAFLEDAGLIKVSYRWHVPGGYKKSREETLPIQSVSASVIEAWIEWVASEKSEGFLDRVARRLREGG